MFLTFSEAPVPTFSPYPARRVYPIDARHATHNNGDMTPDTQLDSQDFEGHQRREVNQDEHHEEHSGGREFAR